MFLFLLKAHYGPYLKGFRKNECDEKKMYNSTIVSRY